MAELHSQFRRKADESPSENTEVTYHNLCRLVGRFSQWAAIHILGDKKSFGIDLSADDLTRTSYSNLAYELGEFANKHCLAFRIGSSSISGEDSSKFDDFYLFYRTK